MLVLGFNGGPNPIDDNRIEDGPIGGHDASVVLLNDGKIVAAIEEERLNRIKHSNKAPLSGMKACLDLGGVSLKDIDRIAIALKPQTFDRHLRMKYRTNENWARHWGHMRATSYIQKLIGDSFGYYPDTDRLHFTHHHIGHAASAFYPSGFDECLILTLDGYGDGLSGLVLEGKGNTMVPLRTIVGERNQGVDELFNSGVNSESNSLGMLYLTITYYLGFKIYDEFKVMGLAPYGDPSKYRHLFQRFYTLLPEGNFELHWARMIEFKKMQPSRQSGEVFSQFHKDIAASLQESLEIITLHMAEHYRKKTGQARLCIAGGVGLNCSSNGKIMYSQLFDDIFVQPASHDGGLSLGAAYDAYFRLAPKPKRFPMGDLFLGVDVGSNEEILSALSPWEDFVEITPLEDAPKKAAELIADDKVIGWVQGRSEFGPRALGNRSILADPRPARNKEIINKMVKKREGFRPFAPSVLEEHMHEYFQTAGEKSRYPYMLFVFKVREKYRELLGAITHVDSTARIQTVSKEHNAKYWHLIHEVGKLIGVPMVLNTSFNNNVEPIVDSVLDGITCYLTTGLDYLIAGDYLVAKKEAVDRQILDSVMSLPRYIKLYPALAPNEAAKPQEVGNSYDKQKRTQVTETAMKLMLEADGYKTVAQLLTRLGMDDAALYPAIVEELRELWRLRLVVIQPRDPNAETVHQPAVSSFDEVDVVQERELQEQQAQFRQALAAMAQGDLEQLRSLVETNPSLLYEMYYDASHPDEGLRWATLLHYLAGIPGHSLPDNIADIATLLTQGGAPIDQRAKDGSTPLVKIVTSPETLRSGVRPALIEILVRAGASMEPDGQRLATQALYRGEMETARSLFRFGVKPNLVLAAGLGNLNLLKSYFYEDGSLKPLARVPLALPGQPLLENPSDRLLKEAACMMACRNGQVKAVDYLRNQGVNLDLKPMGGKGGYLHHALEGDHGREMVTYLLNHVSDPSMVETEHQRTPLALAEHLGMNDLAELLRNYKRTA